MAVDPNIPLGVQQPRFGEIIGQGIQQYRRRQAENELLQLKREEAERQRQKIKGEMDLKSAATFFINLDKEGDVLAQIEQEKKRPGGAENRILTSFEQAYKANPTEAVKRTSQVIEQGRFQKLIPDAPKGTRVNAQIPGKKGIFPAIETEQGFLVDPVSGRRLPTAIKAKKDPLVSIGGEDALTKAIGKKAGEQIVANKDLAVKASDAVRNANEALKLLDEGVVTGVGADFIVNVGRVAKRLGFDVGTSVENTQAFAANQGKAVLDILGSGALGAGTGISDNDRKFARQIAAGDITLDEKAIRRIVALNAKVSLNVINRHNKEFSKIADKSPIDLSVEVPEFVGDSKEDFGGMTEEQVNRLKELRRLQGQ